MYISVYILVPRKSSKGGKAEKKAKTGGKGGKMRSEMTTKGGINPIYKPLIVRDLRNRGKIGEKRGNDVVLRSF